MQIFLHFYNLDHLGWGFVCVLELVVFVITLIFIELTYEELLLVSNTLN